MRNDIEHIKIGIGTAEKPTIHLGLQVKEQIPVSLSLDGPTYDTGGTKDYDKLINKPAIDNHILRAGNNTLEEIGVQPLSNIDLVNILQ